MTIERKRCTSCKKNKRLSEFSPKKLRAKRLGVPFDLTAEQLKNLLESTTTCPVFGIPLVVSASGQKQYNSPSLDRVKPERGYVYDNLAVISWRANDLKKNASSRELRQVADWMDALDQIEAEVRVDPLERLQEAADD